MKQIILRSVSLNPEGFIGMSKDEFMKRNLPCDKEHAWNLIQAELGINNSEIKENGSTKENGEAVEENKPKRFNENSFKKSRIQGKNNSTNS